MQKDSIPDSLAEAAFDRGLQLIDEMDGEMQIREQIEAVRRDAPKLFDMRRLIAEDRVARAWRKSIQIKKAQRKRKKKQGSDDEDEGEEEHEKSRYRSSEA